MLFHMYYIKKREDLGESSVPSHFHFQDLAGGHRLRRLLGNFLHRSAALTDRIAQREKFPRRKIQRRRPGDGRSGSECLGGVILRAEGGGFLVRAPGRAGEKEGGEKQQRREKKKQRGTAGPAEQEVSHEDAPFSGSQEMAKR